MEPNWAYSVAENGSIVGTAVPVMGVFVGACVGVSVGKRVAVGVSVAVEVAATRGVCVEAGTWVAGMACVAALQETDSNTNNTVKVFLTCNIVNSFPNYRDTIIQKGGMFNEKSVLTLQPGPSSSLILFPANP
jgi:hypothetical protein